MDYILLAQDNNFQEWGKLEPHVTDYVKYGKKDPSVIAAAHKTIDVYFAFANARQSFMSAGYNNYGDLCSDDKISKLYIKTHFLIHAITEYAICLDLSWQVIWAYIQPTSFEYLSKNKYKKMERECERDNLLAQLNCAIAQKNLKAKRIKNIMTNFDNDADIKKLRTVYNSLKHRGTIHFVDLGTNIKTMPLQIQNKSISILTREEYTVNEVENILFIYHKKFQLYFNSLLTEIIPNNYMDKEVPFRDFLDITLKMHAIQNINK